MLSGGQLKLFTKTGICSSVSSLHLHWRFCYDISGTIGDPPMPPTGIKNKQILILQKCEKRIQKVVKEVDPRKKRVGSLIKYICFLVGSFFLCVMCDTFTPYIVIKYCNTMQQLVKLLYFAPLSFRYFMTDGTEM